MSNILELLQSAGFIAEATKDGMKILRSRSELNALKKVFEIISEQNEKKLTQIGKMVEELNIESEEDKMKLADKFMDTMSLERQLNAIYIVLNGLKRVNLDKINESGIKKDLFNSFFERSKDITYEDLKATWSELLKIEIENPGTINSGIMNVIENLESKAIDIFNESAQYIFGNFVIVQNNQEKSFQKLNYTDLLCLQDNGLIMQNQSSITTNFQIKGNYLYNIVTEDSIINIGFEDKTTFSIFTLTKVGKTLKKIIPTVFDAEALNGLVEFFKSKKCYFVEQRSRKDNSSKLLYTADNIEEIIARQKGK
jgi:hypothetical protein